MAYSYNQNETLTVSMRDSDGLVAKTNYSLQNIRSGRSVPGHEDLILRNLDASSGYNRTHTFLRQWQPWVQTSRTKSVPPIVKTVWTDQPLYDGATTLLAELDESNEALRKFYKDLDDKMRAFKGSNFVGEFLQVKKLVAARANDLWALVNEDVSKIRRLYKRLRYKDRQPFRRAAKTLSDTWLEYSFGWSPLFSDIADARKAWDKKFDVDNLRVSGSGSRSDVQHLLRKTWGNSPCFWQSQRATHRSIQVRYYAAYRPVCSPMSNWGLNIGSVPGTLWEITPWSFLVDYFVDIGTFLNQVQYANMDYVYVGVSRRKRNRMTTFCTSREVSSVIPMFWSGGKSVVDIVEYSRSPLAEPPVYVPSLNLAGPLKGFRLWNVGALLGSRIRPW